MPDFRPTPPELLRRAADILEQGHARRDQRALETAAAMVWDVFVAIQKALDPIERLAGAVRRERLHSRR